MEYPQGRCNSCGERMYATVRGAYQCHNCGARDERMDDYRYETR